MRSTKILDATYLDLRDSFQWLPYYYAQLGKIHRPTLYNWIDLCSGAYNLLHGITELTSGVKGQSKSKQWATVTRELRSPTPAADLPDWLDYISLSSWESGEHSLQGSNETLAKDIIDERWAVSIVWNTWVVHSHHHRIGSYKQIKRVRSLFCKLRCNNPFFLWVYCRFTTIFCNHFQHKAILLLCFSFHNRRTSGTTLRFKPGTLQQHRLVQWPDDSPCNGQSG